MKQVQILNLNTEGGVLSRHVFKIHTCFKKVLLLFIFGLFL